jgi:hypothetical protein
MSRLSSVLAMEATLALLCDYANVSSDGKLNIMGIYTEIQPTGFPAIVPTSYLVVLLVASPAEANTQRSVRSVLMDMDGKEMGWVEQTFTVPAVARPGMRSTINLITRLDGMVFPKPGDYSFSILVGGDEKASVPVHVNPPK